MGINIELNNYHLPTLWDSFTKETKIEDTYDNYKKFKEVLRYHGIVTKDRFILLNNEYYEDYNKLFIIDLSLGLAFNLVDPVYVDEYYVEEQETQEALEKKYDILGNVFFEKNENHIYYITTDKGNNLDRHELIEKIIKVFLKPEIDGI